VWVGVVWCYEVIAFYIFGFLLMDGCFVILGSFLDLWWR